MDRQVTFRHVRPSIRDVEQIDKYIQRHIDKFDDYFRTVGPLHIEIEKDANQFVCQCWGHFGRGDRIVTKRNGTIIGATVEALKTLERILKRGHDKKIQIRRHPSLTEQEKAAMISAPVESSEVGSEP